MRASRCLLAVLLLSTGPAGFAAALTGDEATEAVHRFIEAWNSRSPAGFSATLQYPHVRPTADFDDLSEAEREANAAAAAAVMNRYLEAFNARDEEAMVATFHFRHVRVGGGGVRVSKSGAEYMDAFDRDYLRVPALDYGLIVRAL